MSRLSHRSAALVAAFVLAAVPAVAQGDDENPQAKAMTITKLRAAADSYRHVPCEFDMVFHGFSQHYNPYFTRFVPERFVNFSAWGVEQAIWERDQFNDDFPYLFVAKASPMLPKFMEMKRFDRVRFVGVVRDTFRGEPWIEVISITPIPGKITEKALIHRVRGDQATARTHHRIAAREYRAVLEHPGLPAEFVLDTTKQLGLALYRARDFQAAHEVFSRLASATPDDADVRALAAQSASRRSAPVTPRAMKSATAAAPTAKAPAKTAKAAPESKPAAKAPVAKAPTAKTPVATAPAAKPAAAPKPAAQPKPAPAAKSMDPSKEPSPFKPLPSQRTGGA